MEQLEMSSIIAEHHLRFTANFSPSKPMSKASSGPFLVGASRPDDVGGSSTAFVWFGVGIGHGNWSSIGRLVDDALKSLVFDACDVCSVHNN